jgi:hypothetical protein
MKGAGMLKSVAVVVGSYLLSVVLVMATNPLLKHLFPGEFADGKVPSDLALISSTALFIAISILCAAACARFSAGRALHEVLWFFVLGEAMGTAAIVANWSNGWPHWYGLSWLLSWPLSCGLGLLIGRRGSGLGTASV